jgi:outer membrane protein
MNRVLCLLLCCITTTIFAQSNEGRTAKVWTLKECVDYALANNLDVQRGQYGVESAEINYTQAKMAMVPTLNASVSNGYNWGRSINPVTNTFVTEQITSISPGANSSVTLFNGMRIQSTIKQNSNDYKASERDLEKAKNDVSLNVVNLYINVIFNKELLEVAKFQLSSSQQQLERTRKQVAAGALPRSNELNLDAQVASNELNVVNGENALNLSLLQLKQALQLPASEAMDVETPAINIEDLILDQSSQQIFEIAKETMPEVKSAQLKVRSSFYALKASKGNLFPRLSLNGSINSNYSSANDRPRFVEDPNADPVRSTDPLPLVFFDPTGTTQIPAVAYQMSRPGTVISSYGYSDQLQDNIFRSVSLSLSIPLFNGLQAKSAVKRSMINQHLAEISAKQVNQTLRQNVETAYNDALAASKSYNATLRQVQSREEAFRMTQQRYDIGAANYVEYQVAENDLFQAKSDLTRAKYNFIFRKKLLDFYQGKPLGF